MTTRPRIVIALTDAQSATLVRGQLATLVKAGFDPILITGPGEIAQQVAASDGVPHIELAMQRNIAPWADAIALLRLISVMRTTRPTIVDGSTPKAGMLALIAATLTGVPVRIHTLRGLRYQTLRGWRRAATALGHLITCRLADHVVCISPSLRDQAIALGLVDAAHAVVLGAGSSHGVDLETFAPTQHARAGAALRAELGIATDDHVVGFIGRLAADKGIAELTAAWIALAEDPKRHLIVVGDDDPSDPVAPAIMAALRAAPRVHFLPFRRAIAPVYAALDVLVLPSHREGFGNVLIEAGAMALPVVATRIVGSVDAVVDGVTGTLIDTRDATALARAVVAYLDDAGLAARHAAAAHGRVTALFSRDQVSSRLVAYYRAALAGCAPRDDHDLESPSQAAVHSSTEFQS